MDKKIMMVLSSIVLIIIIVVAYNNTKATSNDPGSVQDPLVTKSYVDEVIGDALTQVDSKIAELEDPQNTVDNEDDNNTPVNMTDIYNYIDNKFNQLEAGEGLGFVVIEMQAGQKLICEESTELIVRSGNVRAIGNPLGDGISDVTAGIDITNGSIVPTNHLIIIPRTDGRGIIINSICYVMVKGKYTIS